MTEHFGFFDAIQDSNGHYDREYNAQQWTEPFRALVTTGLMKGAYNQLEVTANGANMVSAVKSGIAFIEGRFYFNDALVDLTHDTEVMGLSRIDRIVVRMDSRTEARHVKTFVKKGVPSTNPVAPTLTQTQTVYEISLAQILVVGGQTYITANAVTDERGKEVICPWAGSKILPNFDNAALEQLVNDITALTAPQPWINVVLQNGWKEVSGYKPLQYFKDGFGIIHLSGVIAAPSSGSLITTLPIGYRPSKNIYLVVSVWPGLQPQSVLLNTNGQIIIDGALTGAGERYSFNTTFRVD